MRLSVGDIDVFGISDGVFRMPPEYFTLPDGAGAEWSAHQELLSEDGTVHLPIGCFVVCTAGRVVLIDAGLGPRDLECRGRRPPGRAGGRRVLAG